MRMCTDAQWRTQQDYIWGGSFVRYCEQGSLQPTLDPSAETIFGGTNLTKF